MKLRYIVFSLLAVSFSAAPVFGADGDKKDLNSVILTKEIHPSTDGVTGKYTIHLESYVTGSKVEEITYISQPLDVALVLDRSSSMNNYSVTVNIEESRSEQLTGADMRLGQDYIVTAANGNEYLVKGFKSYTYEDVYTPSTKTWKRSDIRNNNGYYVLFTDGNYYNIRYSGGGQNNTSQHYVSFNVNGTTYYINQDGEFVASESAAGVGKNNQDPQLFGGKTMTFYTLEQIPASVSYEYRYVPFTSGATISSASSGSSFYTSDGDLFTFGTDSPKAGAPAAIKVERYTRAMNQSMTRLKAMEIAATGFIDVIYDDAMKNNIVHQISISNFSGNDDNNPELAFTDVRANYQAICDVINTGEWNSGTWTENGMNKALTAYQGSRPATGDNAVSRVMLMFTDGKPDGGPSHNTDFYSASCINAVTTAFTLKNDYDVTIHSVLLCTESDLADIRYNYFLNMISSNYTDINDFKLASYNPTGAWVFPSATTINDPAYGQKGIEAPNGEGSYFYQTTGSDLSSIFETIAKKSSQEGNTYELHATTTAIIDVVSANFTIPEGTQKEDIRCWVESYIAPDTWAKYGEDGYYYAGGAPDPDVDGNRVTVTNFDFSLDDTGEGEDTVFGNWVGTRTLNGVTYYAGNKLVFEFDVFLNDDYSGGLDMPSNDVNSGIYVRESETDPWVIVKPFPVPVVDFPSICIVKHGLGVNESAIFHISGPDGYSQNVVLTQTANGQGDLLPCYVVIKKLEKGGEYTVKESSWSWTYDSKTAVREIKQSLNMFQFPEGVSDISAKEYILDNGDSVYSGSSDGADSEIGLKMQDAAGQWFATFKDVATGEYEYATDYSNSAVSLLYEFTNAKDSSTSKPARAENYYRNTFATGTGIGGGTEGGDDDEPESGE